jgi:hypothetical protein
MLDKDRKRTILDDRRSRSHFVIETTRQTVRSIEISIAARAAGVANVSQARVYVSFDIEHDRELFERLLAESERSSFSVQGRSELSFESAADASANLVRRRICEADEMIVICGEHTAASQCMGVELRIAQEEHTPYFLLWGRRGSMCTKPIGAKSDEGMYKWTRENVENQVAIALRRPRAPATDGPSGNPKSPFGQ